MKIVACRDFQRVWVASMLIFGQSTSADIQKTGPENNTKRVFVVKNQAYKVRTAGSSEPATASVLHMSMHENEEFIVSTDYSICRDSASEPT
jgi:hypothetical protein